MCLSFLFVENALFQLFTRKPPEGFDELTLNGKRYWFRQWPTSTEYSDIWLPVFPKGAKKLGLPYSIGHLKIYVEKPSDVIWFLSELVVKRPYRGNGIASMLLERVKAEARLHGVQYLIGWATPMEDADPDFDLIGWYEKRGFTYAKLKQAATMTHNIVYEVT